MSFRPVFTILIILALALAGFVFYAFANLGNWLLVSDPEPNKIDLIFTFAGDKQRYDHSIGLLKRHREAKWFASTGNYRRIIEKCREAGIDTARIVTVDTCKSTWCEVEALKEYIEKNKWAKSIGLVSSEWHMRRIKLTISRQRLHNAKFACLPVPLEVTGPGRTTFGKWRETKKTREIVESELVKIGIYVLGLRE